MIKEKNQTYIYLYRVCYIFLIFKFILIVKSVICISLKKNVLFVLKLEGTFEKKRQSKRGKKGLFSLYIV